ncbi:hypothetical protein BDQ17DRAFT_1362629 [Cyathus striatus]|nr:hypothetical protein BDQ17DRAFT_1362629 [Cyathus striatus]
MNNLYILRFILIKITPLNGVKKATEDLSLVKALVKKFSTQRAMCLMVCTEVTFSSVNVNQNRSNSATLYLGAILFTGRISMAYDEVTEENFKMQVRIIGPYFYTLINILLGNILQLILLYEILAISTSIIFSIIVSLSCFILGFDSLVAAGVMGEMLLPAPVVGAGVMVGEF